MLRYGSEQQCFLRSGSARAFFGGDETVARSNTSPYYPGAIAQILIARYFHLQLACSAMAVCTSWPSGFTWGALRETSPPRY